VIRYTYWTRLPSWHWHRVKTRDLSLWALGLWVRSSWTGTRAIEVYRSRQARLAGK
jgi:hypothetical protein